MLKHTSTHRPARLPITLMALVVAFLASGLGAEEIGLAEQGWQAQGEGFWVRDGERSVEYLARGSRGMAKAAPVVEGLLADAKDDYLVDPSETGLERIETLALTLDKIHAMASSGGQATASCQVGPDYGGQPFTTTLACGNRAAAFAYANNFGNCLGPFDLYAYAEANRTCGNTSQMVSDLDSTTGFTTVSASAEALGPYSTCDSYAYSAAVSSADQVLYLQVDQGSGTGCSSNPRTCALCQIIHDDPF